MAVTGNSGHDIAETRYLSGDKGGVEEFLGRFDVFLFDCDGVLWSGDHLFDGVRETLNMLRKRGKRLIFVSNNSTKSRASYKAKFDSMNIPVDVDEIFGSAYSASIYISRILHLSPPNNKVFILGESGISDELDSESIPHIGGPSDEPTLDRPISPQDYTDIASGAALDPHVSVVLGGLDFHVNYLKLSHAFAYLQRGATFLATNGDSTLPNARGLFPGAGSIVAPLVKASGKEPLQLGKPSLAMMRAIEGKFPDLFQDKSRCCMVGDRVDTDIRFGIEGGLGGTLGVLTGVSKKEEFMGEKGVRCTAFVDSLGDLMIAG